MVAAAALGGYAVYNAERTEPVLVATREIPPFTVVNAGDFTVQSIPVSAVHSDALHSESGILGHMTTVGILPKAQVRMAMLSSSTSVQDLVNSTTPSQSVTFSLTYKEGQLQSFIPPDSYVNLVTQGSNNTLLHADHVLVLNNTGYEDSPSPSTTSTQNQNPMLILTLPEQTYMSMAQNIGNNNVQVLMIPQNGTSGTSSGQLTVNSVSTSPSGLTGNNANTSVTINPTNNVGTASTTTVASTNRTSGSSPLKGAGKKK